MSTRSRIAIETRDTDGNQVINSIYCHFDGYPEGVGTTLFNHYTSKEKVTELIKLGDISSLGIRLTSDGPHSFDTPEKGTTVAYHRDRGEDFCEPRVDHSIPEFIKSDVEEYGYLFTEEGEWLIADGHANAGSREAEPLNYVLSGIIKL